MTTAPNLSLPPRVRYPGLSNSAFEHPSDRAALEALRRTPGMDRLLRWMSEMGAERYLRISATAGTLRVSPRQCSRLYNDLREACAILDVPEPEFYLSQSPIPNAFSFGMQRHTLVMTTALVDLLNDTERLEVIGHELGHIKAEHMLYTTMARVLADVMSTMAGDFPLPAYILTEGISFAMYAWSRKSELTADRAGLLTVQDPEVCISALLKLVGGSQKLVDDLNVEEFTRQADAYDDMEDDLRGVYYKLLLMRKQTHPFPAMRAREIKEWSQTEQYKRLLRGDYPRNATEAGKRICTQCGTVVTNVTFRFCPECGGELGTSL